MNATNLLSACDDKAYYPRLFPTIMQPVAIGFVIDGVFYNEQYKTIDETYLSEKIENYKKVIIKPSDGMEGRGVELIEVCQYDRCSLRDKLLSFGKNYVIQEVISQHKSLSVFNESSVNAIRVMTLRMNGKINYLHSTLRFGLPGSYTDMNFIGGKEIAHVCAISSRGEVSDHWYDMDGRKSSFSILGIGNREIIPVFDRIIDTAIAVHEGLHHFDLVGCDITVDQQGDPVLIEYNVYWPGIIIPQYCHGPLFGDLTEELLSQLKKKSPK